MKKGLLIIMFFIIVVVNISAKVDRLIPIEIDYSDDDEVGMRLVYYIKNKIRDSADKYLTYSDDIYPRICLVISTMPRDKDMPDVSSIYSIVYVIKTNEDNKYVPVYYASLLGYTGAARINEVADSIIVDLDRYIEQVILLTENDIFPFNLNAWNINEIYEGDDT